jgi:hypothetical protein
MREKYSDDYKSNIKALFIWTVIGIVYSTVFTEYNEEQSEIGPCFLFIYIIFGIVVIERIIYEIKSVFFKKPED